MDWDKYFTSLEQEKERELEFKREQVRNVYRGYGYTYEQDFPGEYYFMYNSETGEKVRLYYNGRVEEYRG